MDKNKKTPGRELEFPEPVNITVRVSGKTYAWMRQEFGPDVAKARMVLRLIKESPRVIESGIME